MEASIKSQENSIKHLQIKIDEQLEIATEANAAAERFKVSRAKVEGDMAEDRKKLEEVKATEVPAVTVESKPNFDANLLTKLLSMPGEEGAAAFREAAKRFAELNANLDEPHSSASLPKGWIQNAPTEANDEIMAVIQFPEIDDNAFDSDIDDDVEPSPDADASPEEWKVWGAKAAAKQAKSKERKEAATKKRKSLLQNFKSECKEYAGKQQKGKTAKPTSGLVKH